MKTVDTEKNELPKLITATELSEILGLSLNRLWALRKDPSCNIPTPINISKGARGQRWRLNEIERWLDSKQAANDDTQIAEGKAA
ncbi:AlpA family transcriptional regulator [Pseudovibrio sp. Ad37]|uniref:helix-turn-helix transcriptional regulator n=1 Tax=Pseudovibrio sp. Ad37 TaxID=989422 RepID=UPI0007AEB754|nr:hypothetical protein [Pseudovibrio sp. Ad37]KZL13600.1 hypothetical protein PsAD37_05357 [Pseudovibrio sp. Ad37]